MKIKIAMDEDCSGYTIDDKFGVEYEISDDEYNELRRLGRIRDKYTNTFSKLIRKIMRRVPNEFKNIHKDEEEN